MNSHERARQLISARLDGPLSAKEERDLRTHLQGCPDCVRFARQAEALMLGLRGLPSLPAAPPVSRKVMEHVNANPRGSGFGRWFGFAASPGMAVASGLALVAAVTGAVYLATLDDAPGTADRRATISAVALAPEATSTTVPPSVTAAAPVVQETEVARVDPTATTAPEPEPTATNVPAVAAAQPTATATQTVEREPSPTPRPTEAPTLASTDTASKTPTPPSAIRTSNSTDSEPTAAVATEAPSVAYVPPTEPPVETSDAAPAIEDASYQDPGVETADVPPSTDLAMADAPIDAGGADEPAPRDNSRGNRGQDEGVISTAQEVAPVADEPATDPGVDTGGGGEGAIEPEPEAAAALAADEAPVSDEPAPTAEGTPAPVDEGAVDEGAVDEGATDDLSGDGATDSEQGVSEPQPTIAPVAEQDPVVDQGNMNVGLPTGPDMSNPDFPFQTQPQIVPVEDPGAAASNQQNVVDDAPQSDDDRGRRNRNFDELEQAVGIENGDDSGGGNGENRRERGAEPVNGDATTDGQAPEPFLDPVTSGTTSGVAAPVGDANANTGAGTDEPTTIASEPAPVSDAPAAAGSHVDIPLGWAGGANYFQRQYADGRLELREASDGGDGVALWSGVDGGVFNSGVSGVEFTPGGDRFAFFSGGALYVAPASDPNAASAVPASTAGGYSWNPAGDMLAVSDGSGILIFGAFGEGPLMSAATESAFPIADITWQADGIAVTRSDTGEIELVPV